MAITVAELARSLGLAFTGNGDLVLTHACGLEGELPGGISYVEHPRYVKDALASQVQVFVCRPQIDLPGRTRILSEQPDLCIVEMTKLLHPARTAPGGVHPSVILGADCRIGEGVTLEAGCVLGDRVTIGARTWLMAGCVVGHDCKIGEDGHFHPRVVLRDDTRVGDRVVINAGAVLGSDGYGFVTHQGRHHKIPQVGYVDIEDDVEIGANNTIDRGRFGVTRIGKGTKLDNLVHVGHNVEIGEHSLIVGMVGFAGSTKIGHHLIIGGQSMITGHLKIGNHVTVSAKSMLDKEVGDGERWAGIPARPHREWLKALGYLYRLGEVFEQLKSLRRHLPPTPPTEPS